MTDDPVARARALGAQLADLVRRGADAELVSHARRKATRDDPALFAVVYLAHHVSGDDGRITFADVHLAWCESAKRWMHPVVEPADDRRAEVAPRDTGKSTWWFLILPLWAAAHEHVKFAAAFADSSTQAETHLATLKRELDTNDVLRADYPDLVEPYKRARGATEADRVSLYHARSDFVFAAAGMDGSNLGLKVGERRPDLLILDDIEPHEAKYSAAQAAKRLTTLRQAIFPLNIRAHVIMVGTVTMYGSIIHQVVRASHGDVDDAKVPNSNAWVVEDRIEGRHTRPLRTEPDGTEVSIWPEKWSTAFLLSIRHTRGFALNYDNDPLGADGDYWQRDDFVHARPIGVARVVVSVDPAVTTKASSDPTGIGVVGYSPVTQQCVVLAALEVKLPPDELRELVLGLIAKHDAGRVLVETNQGGDLWPRFFHDMPVPVKTVHQTVRKEVRAASVLEHYQSGKVLHDPRAKLTALEGQMIGFPNAPHDDMVDAVGSAVAMFLDKPKRQKAGGSVAVYGG